MLPVKRAGMCRDLERKRQYMRDYARRKYADRKANGLCGVCGKPSGVGYALCRDCRTHQRRAHNETLVTVYCNEDGRPDRINETIFEIDLWHGHYEPGTLVVIHGKRKYITGEPEKQQSLSCRKPAAQAV